jgi:hypothetical protein
MPSAKDQSAIKLASSPAKIKAHAIHFNHYGSNLEEDKLFKEGPILQPEAISMMIVIDDDSAPNSDVPVDPQVLKCSKLLATDGRRWDGRAQKIGYLKTKPFLPRSPS